MILDPFKLSCERDVRDPRDFRKACVAAPLNLPISCSVPNQPPILNQGQTNACTGYATAFMWEQILRSRGMLELDLSVRLSPSYVWYYGRAEIGAPDQDTGVGCRSIMKALAERGICPEDEWPADYRYDIEPSKLANLWGQALRLPKYERCDSVQSIKYALAVEKQAVLIGLPVYECWGQEPMIRTGVCPERAMCGALLGWHALAVVGYRKDRFIMANSWGTNYGDAGYVSVPFEYLDYESEGETLPGFDAWTAGLDALSAPK